MSYIQITPEERYTLATLRKQVPRLSNAEIARIMGRHRSTIGREIVRNRSQHDLKYRCGRAQEKANGRRSRSRRRCQFTSEDWSLVEKRLREFHSPKQISGRLRQQEILDISHESIYLHVWRDKQRGGDLHRSLRQSRKKARKRYGSYEKRGRVDNKRHLSERPAVVESRSEVGHWEIDTVMGATGDRNCIVTLVERATGVVLIGKLRNRTAAALNDRVTGPGFTGASPGMRPVLRPQPPLPVLRRFATSSARRASPSISRPRTTPGSGAPTKTPMG